jgi:hypothetical protein
MAGILRASHRFRASTIYLHAAHGADRAIADGLPVELDQADEDDPADDDGAAGALVPGWALADLIACMTGARGGE